MFDIGWSEMAIIMLVALIVIGPKDLPRVARNVGRWIAKGRALARDFQNQLEDMAREAELDKVKTEIEKAGRTDLKRSVERSIDPKGELKDAFDPDAKPAAGKDAKPAAGKDAKPAAGKDAKPAAGKKEGESSPRPAAKEGAATGAQAKTAEPAPAAADAGAEPRLNGAANGSASPEPAPAEPRKEQAPTH